MRRLVCVLVLLTACTTESVAVPSRAASAAAATSPAANAATAATSVAAPTPAASVAAPTATATPTPTPAPAATAAPVPPPAVQPPPAASARFYADPTVYSVTLNDALMPLYFSGFPEGATLVEAEATDPSGFNSFPMGKTQRLFQGPVMKLQFRLLKGSLTGVWTLRYQVGSEIVSTKVTLTQ